VRVHPLFWVIALLFGSHWLDAGVQYALTWVAIVFVSILVHELGHALAYRRFGADSHIVLYAFGGLAVPWSAVRSRWQRIVVSLSGPGAQFLLCGAVYGSNEAFHWAGGSILLALTYAQLIFINLYWAIFNLLPVWPLDGGQVCSEVCMHFNPRTGLQTSLRISIGTAVAICVYSVLCVAATRNEGLEFIHELPWWVPRGGIWTAVLFGMLAYQSYQVLERVKWNDSHWER
jgi:Zn-dependent protease